MFKFVKAATGVGLFGACALAAAPARASEAPDAAAPEVPAPAQVPEPPVERDANAEPPAVENVRVNGSKRDRASGSVTVITAKQIERFKHDDVHALLAQAPGVYTRGEDGVGLRPNIGLRGVNPDRSKKVTLLEDGVLFGPAPYSAPAAYYFPLMSRISGVRIVKGAAAIAEGPQTIAGAIDLVTRPIPGLASGALELSAGQYGFARMSGHFGSSDDRTGFLVEGASLSSTGFKELPGGEDTGFTRNEWMVKVAHLLEQSEARRQEIRVKGVYSDETSNETYLGLTNADFAANPNRRYGVSSLDQMRNHRTGLAITHEVAWGKDLTLTTTAYRNDFARVWRKVNGFRGADLFDVLAKPSEGRNAVYVALLRGQGESASSDEALFVGPNDRTYFSYGVQSRLHSAFSTGEIAHRFESGIRLHEDGITRRHTQDAFRIVRDQLVPEGSATVTTAFNDARTAALAAHLYDAMTWDFLTLTPGVRVEAYAQEFRDRMPNGATSSLTDAVVLPGVGIFAGLTPELGALAGVHRGFSPPAPGSANTTEPELSTNYEGGLRWIRGRERLEAVGFYNDYNNLTSICTLSSGCVDANLDRQFNAGRARIYGLEAIAEHDIPVGDYRVPILASYTYTRSSFLADFASEDPSFGAVKRGDELPYLPRHQASVTVGIEGKEGGIAAVGNYVAAMREEAGSEPLANVLATDRQLWLDVSGRVRLTEHLLLQLNGRNVIGDQFIVSHRPFGARPNAPRWLQAGLSVTF